MANQNHMTPQVLAISLLWQFFHGVATSVQPAYPFKIIHHAVVQFRDQGEKKRVKCDRQYRTRHHQALNLNVYQAQVQTKANQDK